MGLTEKGRHSRRQARARVRNKVVAIAMAAVLVFTMMPVTAFSVAGEGIANAVSAQNEGADGTAANAKAGTVDAGGTAADSASAGGSSASAGAPEDGSQNADADASDGSASAEGGSQDDGAASGSAATSGGSGQDGAESTDGQGASQQDEQENAAGEGDANGSASENAGTADETRSPLAWQRKLDACTVDGELTVETSRLDAPAWNASELPEMLFATLHVSFEITPGKDQLVSGDTIEVALPTFAAYAPEQADDGSTPDLDAFRLNEDGTKTDEAIASAQVKDGVLKATFSDAAATDDANVTVRGFVDVPVSFASSLLGDAETQQPWTVQEDGDDERIVMLALPAYDAVLQAWRGAHGPLNSLLSVFGLGNAAVTAQSTTADEDAEVTVAAGSFDYRISSITTWCDNNYDDRPTAASLEKGYIPQYSLDKTTYYDLVEVGEDGTVKVTDQAKADLHLSDAQVRQIEGGDLINVSQTAVSTYTVQSMALPSAVVTTTTTPVLDGDGNPTYDEHGNQNFDTEQSSQLISWKLRDTNTYAGYILGTSSTWDHQYLMLTTNVEFHVVGKTGDTALSSIFGEDDEDDFRFGATIDSKDEGSSSIAQAVKDGWLEIEDVGGGCTITGTLPRYDTNGYPIVYYIQYTGEQSGTDYYQVSYDNSNSESHGSATDAAYTSGTMTLRHAGTTTYNGTKVWLDGGDSASRPAATFTLWRYSLKGGSAATASQVSLSSTSATPPEVAANAASYVTVTVPAGNAAGSVDLHQLLVEAYGQEAIDSLPKYDPDGYPYIYCMREEAIAGYEQVFGSVGEDGSVADTPPSYQNSDGEWTELQGSTRPDSDRFVYNNGTISNRLTGTVEVDLTKTWTIAAFQDSLKDVVCTFQAQSRPADSTDDADWENVTGEGATQTLSSWNAETLSKTVSSTFPKYDAQGRELAYRWVETGVALDGQDTAFTAGEDGSASFHIQVTDAEGQDETLQFTSTPTVDEEGNTTIVNSFENTTDQHVDKYWEQPDGTQAQIAPDPGYTDGDATIELYRDGQLIGTFTLDGKTDATAAPIEGLGDATWKETRSYHADFENLPKYSPEGKRYTYLVLEVAKDGWYTTRSYDPTTRTTRIDNYFPKGEGSEIRITKSWLDGDDAAHRLDVEVSLVANRDMQSQATKTDPETGEVTPLYSYKKGDTVVSGIRLSSAEMWYAEVGVPIGGLTYNDFTAVETALIDDRGTPGNTEDDIRYEVVDKAQAQKQYPDELWINAGWNNDNKRVATPEHVYEVKSQSNTSMRSCEVTNRRLGLLDLTVTKQWHDGLGDLAADDVDNPRPEATLTVSCSEYPEAFSLNEEGELVVSVSGNTLPVTDSKGNAVKATIVDADGNPVQGGQGGNARISVDRTKGSSTYELFGLPKYDAAGLNVHYDVNESWAGESGDYSSTKTVGAYTVEPGARHFHDTQKVAFDNTRHGTRDVVFYKSWHDNYVSGTLNQRPDIYLTLYRMVKGGTPQAVEGYIHFLWQGAAAGGDATNEQMVTISGLPAYDSNGVEYIYYASESMSADGTSLGYGDVQFEYDSIKTADADESVNTHAAEGAANAVNIDEATAENDPEENGSGWAIREDGTFVNSLSGTLTVQGTKLWENIPGNVSQGDLPEVTIYLQQRVVGQEWPQMVASKGADGTWSVSGIIGSTSDLTRTTANQYTYTIDKDTEGNPLPRYTADGDLYEYRCIEVVWGLLGKPGGFTEDDIADKDLTQLVAGTDGSASLNLVGDVYVVQHGESGSFLLRNVYGGDKGKLTVKKLFSGRSGNDLYPGVTFNVYRYYIDDKGQASTPDLAATHTLTQDDFAAGTPSSEEAEAGNNSASYTFENLDVYAPDGSYWIYYVAERDINGYETTVGTGDLQLGDSRLVTGERINDRGVAPVEESAGTAVRSDDLGTFVDGAITGSVLADDEDVDVTFANEYTPGTASLSGTKVWNDYGNIFSVRPSRGDDLGLKFTRSAGSMTEDVDVQTNDPGEANYLKWTASDETGDWTFTLSNVEKWAPNGQAWTYTVAENLSGYAANHYTVVTGTSSISADGTAQFRLENALNGQATVSKTWVDGGDPYGLRPETVTVQLQARTTTDLADDGTVKDGATYSTWDAAYNVWKQFASEEALTGAGFTEDKTRIDLDAAHGWRGSWTQLPVLARQTAGSDLTRIEYRAVEVAIGDQEITVPTDDDATYGGDIHPYQPSQTNSTSNEVNSFSTSITNTLEATSISATKTWSDQNDVWGTRPGGGTTWKATYFLQHSTNGTDWEWVVEAGSEASPSGSAAQNGVVSLEVSGTGDSATVTWDNLPQYDTSGAEYQYRVVEQVPGSYDLSDQDAEQVEDTDTAHRYYVVPSTSGGGGEDDSASAQTFTNTLRTVDLTGTKAWEDFGTDIAPELDQSDLPQMTLWRAVKNADGTYGTAERVLRNGNPAQPTWADNGDGTWTFAYTGMPAADENDQDYVYWATESAGSGNTDGFYPVYGTDSPGSSSHGAAGTKVDQEASAGESGKQTNETITNTATKIALDKVSTWLVENDGQNDWERLANIELSVQSRDGSTTYAVWTNGANGTTYNTYTWANGTTNPNDTSGAVHRTDNLIVGLKAGDYTLVETGDVPDGYAICPEINFQINADGTATFEGAKHDGQSVTTPVEDVHVSNANGVHTIELAAQDPVLRGHLQLTKYVSADGKVEAADAAALQGATFSLYRKGDNGASDQLVAEGLTTNAQGVITTVGNDTKVEEGFADAYDGKYIYLRDGLPEGDYYFEETSTTPGSVLPQGDAAKSPVLTITQGNHYDYTGQAVNASMGNEVFNATVILHKYDTFDGMGIGNVQFTLAYTPEGSSTSTSRTVTTAADGTLKLENLEKGSYTLTEASNTGYANNGFSATFTIGNEDDDQTFDIKSIADGTDIGFDVTSEEGTFVDGLGIPNDRLTGQVTLNKRGNATAIDATFDLQLKQGDSWTTAVSGLETSHSYELAWNDDGVTATAKDMGSLNPGQLTVTGLTWNTYRFVETATAPGYLPNDANGDITSSEFTIGRGNAASTSVGVTVQNAQTDLQLNKRNEAHQALAGAEFQITPVGKTTFADGKAAAKTITSNGSGLARLTGQLVVGGTYEIYELTAPTGYDPVDKTFQVTVEEDGSLAVVGGDKALPEGWERADLDGDGTADDQFSFTATNNHMAIQLVKTSSDNADLRLDGATFRLVGMCMDNNTAHDYTTDENGAIAIDAGLMGGVDYTLTELTPPDGYAKMSEPLHFRMNDRGEITVDGDVPEGWSVGDGKISLTAADDPVELQITKRAPEGADGSAGALLEGATFTVTPVAGSAFADGSTDAQTLTTGADGVIAMSAQLVVGNSYDITEATAPEGYERVTGTMRITVGTDGVINVVGSVDENGQVTGRLAPTGYEKVADSAFEVQVTNEPVEVTINKVDADDHGTRLDGAVFEVTGVFAGQTTSTTREYTTTSDGTLVGVSNISAELKSGQQYTLTEKTAPAGYELVEGTLTFTVGEDGTITTVGDVPAGYSVEQGNVSIVASDTPIDVSFAKMDLGDDNALAGAEFTISGNLVDDATHEVSHQQIAFTTDGTGLDLAQLVHDGATYSLVAGETYTVTEQTAPSGYELTDPFGFTVNADGTISVAAGSSQAAAGEPGYVISGKDGAVVLTAHDKPIEVVLAKTGSGAALPGATFELYQGASAAEGTLLDTVTTGDDGQVALTGLVGGQTYTLHEVAAPAGFELLGDATFTVGTDGTVAFADGVAGYRVANADDGVATITADDTPIEAQLVKTDADGSPLAGAVFTVEGTFAGDYANEGSVELAATGADGIARIPSAALIAGETYTITEVTAPDGYELAGAVQFTVGADGALSIAGATGADPVPGEGGTGTYAASADDGVAVITATDTPVELAITKTDGGEGLLPGAEFTATAVLEEGETGPAHTVTATTGDNGTAVLAGLIAGKTYVLSETKAPAGYELQTDTLRFAVQPDGTVDAGWFPPAAFEVGQNGDSVTVADDPLLVSFVKQAPNGAPLSGAEFTVEGPFPDGSSSKTFTSDADGNVFVDMQLSGSAEGTVYAVTETKAPDGYLLPEGSLSLVVYEDGTVAVGDGTPSALKEAASVSDEDGVAVVALENEPAPGTALPQTGDTPAPWLPGALGIGILAVLVAGIAAKKRRPQGEHSIR